MGIWDKKGVSIQEEEVMGTERKRGPRWTEKPVNSKGYGEPWADMKV